MTEYLSLSVQMTENIASELAKELKKGDFVAMYGDLGAGKTAFVRGAATAIAPDAYVQSPTYTVVNEYHGKNGLLFHFDMYRIDDEDSLDSIGYWDYLERGGYCFVEWSEKIPFALPGEYYRLEIRKHADDDNARTITITKEHI
jgi:tRNA threonylcarbamoyladenosine biosynthesis protein TsaE